MSTVEAPKFKSTAVEQELADSPGLTILSVRSGLSVVGLP